MSKFYKGEIAKGCVTGIEKYGIFVSLDEYYSGLIHISEISDDFVKDINSVASIGETIKVRVLESNDETFQVKLSIKNLDYQIKNNKKGGIIETKNGYNNLGGMLEKWIYDRKN